MSSLKTGVDACEEAFQRLRANRPMLAKHVGIDPAKITPAIVSVEAGFDRGYLKKGRPAHRELIARIGAAKSEALQTGTSIAEKLRRAQRKAEKAKQELVDYKEMYHQLAAYNLLLTNKIMDLENQLGNYQNIRHL